MATETSAPLPMPARPAEPLGVPMQLELDEETLGKAHAQKLPGESNHELPMWLRIQAE